MLSRWTWNGLLETHLCSWHHRSQLKCVSYKDLFRAVVRHILKMFLYRIFTFTMVVYICFIVFHLLLTSSTNRHSLTLYVRLLFGCVPYSHDPMTSQATRGPSSKYKRKCSFSKCLHPKYIRWPSIWIILQQESIAWVQLQCKFIPFNADCYIRCVHDIICPEINS